MDTSRCGFMKKLHWVDRLLIVFLVIWTLLALLEDGLAAWDLYRQCESTGYHSAQGVITRNETVCHDYDLHEVETEYTYYVDGTRYTGNRYIYDAMMFGRATSGSQRRAKKLERSFPVGQQVTIYHNPLGRSCIFQRYDAGRMDNAGVSVLCPEAMKVTLGSRVRRPPRIGPRKGHNKCEFHLDRPRVTMP